MASGIATSAAIFSVVNAVLLKPLPYPEADRLVAFVNTRRGEINTFSQYVSAPRIRAWTDHAVTVSDVAACLIGASVNLTGVARPQQVIAGRVTANFRVFMETTIWR